MPEAIPRVFLLPFHNNPETGTTSIIPITKTKGKESPRLNYSRSDTGDNTHSTDQALRAGAELTTPSASGSRVPRWEETPRPSPARLLSASQTLTFPEVRSQLTFLDPTWASAQSVYFAHRVLLASGGGPSTFPVPLQTRYLGKGFR